MGWFSDMLFGKRKKLDIGKIQGYMEPAQALVNRQVGFSDMFTDLDSPFNRQYQGLLQNLAQTQGQQTGSNLMKMAAMRNVSPGQALMQSSTAQNQAQGQGYNQYMQSIMDNVKFGGGLLADATFAQTGLSENLANAYVGNVNAHNQARANRQSGLMGLAGNVLGGWASTWSDKRLKENIELVGKSDSGTNIYEFDYKNKEGRYRGVMADEVPNASFKGPDGYLMVDYDKVDVNFERIS
tara:strand:+ start:447 stop:1163 length:717 start_codon:yes stop_codon:yes gene_type:complete